MEEEEEEEKTVVGRPICPRDEIMCGHGRRRRRREFRAQQVYVISSSARERGNEDKRTVARHLIPPIQSVYRHFRWSVRSRTRDYSLSNSINYIDHFSKSIASKSWLCDVRQHCHQWHRRNRQQPRSKWPLCERLTKELLFHPHKTKATNSTCC